MFKKIICMGVLLTMIFSLSGCNPELAAYKSAARTELTGYVHDLRQSSYTAENWALAAARAKEGAAGINAAKDKVAVDTAKAAAIQSINEIPKEKGMEDFVLTISIEETTVRRGEDFKAHVELKNQSGEDREIGFSLGFIAHIPGYIDFFDPNNPDIEMPEPQSIILKNNGILRNIRFWGNEAQDGILITGLSSGTYKLSFHFLFGFSGQSMRIWSNTIVLNVK